MSIYLVKKTADVESIGDGMTAYAVSRNDGKKGKSGLICVAPSISDSVLTVFQNDAAGKVWIVNQLIDLKSRVISALNASGKTISDESIGITALIAAATQENSDQRMTKESIGLWFDAELAPLVAARIQERMAQSGGISDDKVATLVAAYRKSFQDLAQRGERTDEGKVIEMDSKQTASLIKAMELLPSDHDHVIGLKVADALSRCREPQVTLVALG